MEIYDKAPIPGVDRDKVREEARKILRSFLSDPNVWSFLIAARELDLHGFAGSIPNLSREEFQVDSKRIVADEVLGMALATYLAGVKAVFSMYWIERLKENKALEHYKLEMFEDDVVSALLASLLTKLLDESEELKK